MSNFLYKISGMVDLTLLDPLASSAQFQALSQEADQHQVASICVYPVHLTDLSTALPIPRTTVINFPSGNEDEDTVLKALDKITQAQEIDYVFPYSSYLSGHEHAALLHCQRIIQACKHRHLKVKVILETEVYPTSQALYDLCLKVIALGCDFLKTSTGTKPVGATLEAAEIILTAIKETGQLCGLKISGGIKNPSQVAPYIALAEAIMQKSVDASWFRVGSSKLFRQ